MTVRSVLVVGGGLAGSTCADLLARHGITVTVVERSGEQRSSGSPVDVRGAALAVVARMDVADSIRAAATQVRRLAAVDDHGRTIGWIPTQARPDAVEVSRSELAAILATAASRHVEFVYGDMVTALSQDPAGVDVTFEHIAERRFDLVIGADGLHSSARRLAFGSEERFIAHQGLYFATLPLGQPSRDRHTVLILNHPGRAVVIHPTTGLEGAGFFFRHPQIPEAERRDVALQRRLLTETYQSMGWRVPELLTRIRDSDELYFDSVSRVSLKPWARGRIVLVGDAADCISLFGEGSSMAIVGAATLADALADRATTTADALERYEVLHRKQLRLHQRGAALASRLLVPRTRAGLSTRNTVMRAVAVSDSTRYRLLRKQH